MPTKKIATYEAIEPLEALRPDLAVIIGGTTAAGAVIAQGDVLGADTNSAYRRRTVTKAAAAIATNSKLVEVADAVFLPGDVLTNANAQTIGTVAKVADTLVTLAANAAVAVADGAPLRCINGAEKAQGISDSNTDGDGEAQISMFIAGLLTESRLRGLDDVAQAELGGVSLAGVFKF